MSKTFTNADRSRLIRLASTLPTGSDERKAILVCLGKPTKTASQTHAESELYYTQNLLEVKVPEAREREAELRDLLGKYVEDGYGPYRGKLPTRKNDPMIRKLVEEYGNPNKYEDWLEHLPVEVESNREEIAELKRDLRQWQRTVDQERKRNASVHKTASKKTTLSADLKLKDGTVYAKGSRAEVFFSERNPSMSEVEIEGRKIKLRTVSLHKYLRGFPKPPSMRALQKMESAASGPTVTGVRNVEMDGYGPDGSPSWMLAMGLI